MKKKGGGWNDNGEGKGEAKIFYDFSLLFVWFDQRRLKTKLKPRR